jgi:hypothetical protein
MENYNYSYFKAGMIVKITRGGEWDAKGEYAGFISEIIKPPHKIGDIWNYTLLYGNEVRKEYSEMNFYDPSVLVQATQDEIRLYKAMRCMANDLEDRRVIALHSNRRNALPGKTHCVVGKCLYNLYEDGIYVPDKKGYPNIIKIFSTDTGFFASGIPDDTIKCFEQ